MLMRRGLLALAGAAAPRRCAAVVTLPGGQHTAVTQQRRRLTVAATAQAAKPVPEFHYQDIFETTGELDIPWRKLTGDYVQTLQCGDRE